MFMRIRGWSGQRIAWSILATTAVLFGGLTVAEGRPAHSPGMEQHPAPVHRDRGLLPLPTTAEDFFQPGTQPRPDTPDETPFQEFYTSFFNCLNCHAFDDEFLGDDGESHIVAPYTTWVTSMMAQSARDPVWRAALAISNEEATLSGEYCIRCHVPSTWGSGRSASGDMSEFILPDDHDAVSCHFCHRMVDPVVDTENPPSDVDILQQLVDAGTYPMESGNGRFIFDPVDTRRGPEEWAVNMHGADILVSPHHNESSFCASCHDLRNPVLSLQSDGSYEPNAHGAAHPTQNMHDMFPEQLTYSEWLNSDFSDQGVYFPDGRFGGDVPAGTRMSSCQDCHMPKHYGASCIFWEVPGIGFSPDIPDHAFVGANNWVIGAVHELYDPNFTGLSTQAVDRQRGQTEAFLAAASDMDIWMTEDNELRVTITNWSGHKLPTGFPEGRRIWINVRYFDPEGDLVDEIGAYDFTTGDSFFGDTKVYEMKLGLDADMAASTGLPEGPNFSVVLANTVIKDNRIPPAGFTNAAYEAMGGAPVGVTYNDFQHWDETYYTPPSEATEAVITLYYQASSKEYMEYLRDNSPPVEEGDTAGQIAWDAWIGQGMSPPVVMDSQMVTLAYQPKPGDVNNDGYVNVGDLLQVIGDWGCLANCIGDADGNGIVTVADLLLVIANWGT